MNKKFSRIKKKEILKIPGFPNRNTQFKLEKDMYM